MAVTLSEKAAKHVANYMAKRGKGVGLRLGVRTSGCSGVAYKLEFVDVVEPDDVEFESYGVKVFIDAKNEEIINIYSQAAPMDKTKAINIMKEIDPANGSKYQQIMQTSR